MSLFFNLPGVFVDTGVVNNTWGDAEGLVSRCQASGVRWICLQVPDNDDQVIAAVREAMKGRGMYFGIWEWNPTSLDLLNHVKPNFWVLNVEDRIAGANAAEILPEFRAQHPKLPAGIVTNCDFGDPKPWLAANIRGLPEAYQNDNPQATPLNMAYRMRKLGWHYVFPVLGCYHDYPLSNYKLDGQVNGFSVYLAEGMNPPDWQIFAQLAQHS